MNQKKKVPVFDHDIWEKLYSALILAGVLLIIGLVIKSSLEAFDFDDTLDKTIRYSVLISFHLSAAAAGSFAVILLFWRLFFKHQKFGEIMTPSIKGYLIFFGIVAVADVWFNLSQGFLILDNTFFILSLLGGMVLAVLVHLIGKIW